MQEALCDRSSAQNVPVTLGTDQLCSRGDTFFGRLAPVDAQPGRAGLAYSGRGESNEALLRPFRGVLGNLQALSRFLEKRRHLAAAAGLLDVRVPPLEERYALVSCLYRLRVDTLVRHRLLVSYEFII